MIYVSNQQTRTGRSNTELDRTAYSYKPTLGEQFGTAFSYEQTAEGSMYEDIQVGFVAREIGAEGTEYFLQRKVTGDPIFESIPGAVLGEREGENAPLTKEQYEQSPYFREDLPYLENLTTWAAENRALLYDKRQVKQDILGRDSSFVGQAVQFTGLMAGSMADAKNIAVGGAVAAGASAATPVVGAIAGTATWVGRGVNTARRSYNTMKAIRPMTTRAGEAIAFGAAVTVPQAVTGVENAEITGSEYTLADAGIDIMAGALLDGTIEAGVSAVSAIRGRYFKRNATVDEQGAIMELATAQMAAGEKVDVQPLVDAIVMRDPPDYSTVNFQSEAPSVTKGQDGNYVATFSDERGLMAGVQGTGKSRAAAVSDLRTKYMGENIPQQVVSQVGANPAARMRDLALAKNEMARTSFALSAKDAMDGQPDLTTNVDIAEARKGYDNALERLAVAEEEARLKPNSTKRASEKANAQNEVSRQERIFEEKIRQTSPDLAARIDRERAQALGALDRQAQGIRSDVQQEAIQRMQNFAEKQTDPDLIERLDAFQNTYTFDQVQRDAQALRQVVNNQEALEGRRLEARNRLEELTQDVNYPEDQKVVIREALAEVDAKRSLNDKLVAYQYRLAHEGRTDAEDIFPSNDRDREVYDELRKGAELLQEIKPIKNEAEAVHKLITDLVLDTSEEIAIREVQLLNTMQAREQMTLNMKGFVAQGETHSMALRRTLERASNDVAHERTQVQNSFSVAMDRAGVDKFFSKLSRTNDREASLNILKEIENVENGGAKPLTASPEAFKLAQIYKTLHDSYRYRGYQTGLRTRNLKRHFLEQYWNPNQLRNSGTRDQFADDMAPRIDVIATFGEEVSPVRVKDFLRDFYDRRVNGTEDVVRLQERELFASRKTDYARMFENREIKLRTDEDSLHVIQQYGGGSVNWGIINSLSESATRARMSEVYGVNPVNMKEHLIYELFKDAPQIEKDKVRNPTLFEEATGGNIDHIIMGAGIDVENNVGNMNMVQVSSTLRNLTRAVLLEAALLASIPDIATSARAKARLRRNLNSDIRRKMRQSMKNVPEELKEHALRSVSTANAYTIGEQMAKFAGNSTSVKLANFSIDAANFVFRYGGMNWWTSIHKKSAYVYANTFYANALDLPYAKMEEYAKGALTRAGLTEADWGTLKNYRSTDPTTNSTFLYPDRIAAKDQKLAGKVNSLLIEFTDEAVPTPGVREKAMLGQFKKISDVPSFLTSFVGTLLGYPVTFTTKAVNRELSVGGLAGVTGLALLGASTTLLGSMAEVAVNMSGGRTIDPTESPEAGLNFLMSSFARGAGGAFLSSLLIEAVTYGDTATGLAAGVTPSLIDDAAEIIIRPTKAALDGDSTEEIAAEAVKEFRKFVPADFPVVRGLFDQFVYYPLLDYLDPDIIDRMEDRHYERTGGELRPYVN